jgi:hypothetical protein
MDCRANGRKTEEPQKKVNLATKCFLFSPRKFFVPTKFKIECSKILWHFWLLFSLLLASLPASNTASPHVHSTSATSLSLVARVEGGGEAAGQEEHEESHHATTGEMDRGYARNGAECASLESVPRFRKKFRSQDPVGEVLRRRERGRERPTPLAVLAPARGSARFVCVRRACRRQCRQAKTNGKNKRASSESVSGKQTK